MLLHTYSNLGLRPCAIKGFMEQKNDLYATLQLTGYHSLMISVFNRIPQILTTGLYYQIETMF